jgi:hypothetical protein
MDADWEVEIGGGAPVIEADWPGFINLRGHSERGSLIVKQVAEAAAFPPLATLLLALNADRSPLWTSKCDLWEPEPEVLAIYVDMLPLEGNVFVRWQQADSFCREYVARLSPMELPEIGFGSGAASGPDCAIVLVIRQAVAGHADGFGITAYLSAKGTNRANSALAMAATMAAFADALPPVLPPATAVSKHK